MMTRSRNRKGRRSRYVYDAPKQEPQMGEGTLTLDQIKQLATETTKSPRGRRCGIDCSFVSAYPASEKHRTPQLYFSFHGDDAAYFDADDSYTLYFVEAFDRLYSAKEQVALLKNMQTVRAYEYRILRLEIFFLTGSQGIRTIGISSQSAWIPSANYHISNYPKRRLNNAET